ncbi:hypothetical protein [Chitinophaga ginsengisoli]|uniref:Uncharacterized protein n=1 Tax=Chitinophaga ginsengisoli TaxID=363837 RepID=A0A2P8FBX6_9BACT|nr:hypothetical protein [Chitinophaga ginsengisoli]PSL19210.1 hypothetical protein CLV42_1298 [Chitinophaga ginsengisoli]
MKPDYSHQLFDDCATNCEAYAACGGCRTTAPCLCVYPMGDSLRYACNKCQYLCRERGVYCNSPNLKVKSFEEEFAQGQLLNEVKFSQTKHSLPVFIPESTHVFRHEKKFTEWVAVDIRSLFLFPRQEGAILRDRFNDAKSLREFLNVSDSCKLVAILNGNDRKLESFWAGKRKFLLKKIASLGFSICTSPTYSLNSLTTTGAPVPALHNVSMLMRHHRVLTEINEAELCAVPNLYTLDRDRRQIREWGEWLKSNTGINIVSRDFTSTRSWDTVKIKLDDLIQTLKLAGRSFQVIIVGTGHANAIKVATTLSSSGHIPTIVTAAPILKAIKGGKYHLTNEHALKADVCPKDEMNKSDLIWHNLNLFEEALTSSTA